MGWRGGDWEGWRESGGVKGCFGDGGSGSGPVYLGRTPCSRLHIACSGIFQGTKEPGAVS